MALKKQIQNSTKYLYATIYRLAYGKNAEGYESGVEHQMQVVIFAKDNTDPEYQQVENRLVFTIPSIRIIQKEQTSTEPKIDPVLGEPMLDEEGNIIYETVSHGFNEAADETYQDPFAIEKMNPQDMNITKLGYDWLKNNVLLFSDFEDC